jgi:hypothetical protein
MLILLEVSMDLPRDQEGRSSKTIAIARGSFYGKISRKRKGITQARAALTYT